MRIAICDDEKNIANTIHQKIVEILRCLNISFEIDVFHNGYDLLDNYPQQYDVIFLDIYLGDINGFKLAENIRKHDSKVLIIFLTSSGEFVYDGYKIGAFRYILKKSFNSEIRELLVSVIDNLRTKKSYIIAKNKQGFKKISCDDILYISSDLRKLKICSFDSIETFYGKLSCYENELAKCDFIRTHQSYIVNIKYIKALTNDSIVLDNNTTIPISRAYLKKIKEKVIEYFG